MAERARLMYIPLDSRPINSQTPLVLAKVAGAEVISPPLNRLGTLNSGAEKGFLLDFITQNGGSVDAVALSLNALFSGGLVQSRNAHASVEDCRAVLSMLGKVREAHPKLRIVAFGVLPRLSVTADIEGMGPWLRLQNFFDHLRDDDEVEIGPMELKRYFRREFEGVIDVDAYFRNRGFALDSLRSAIRWASAGTIDFLLIGQDDAAKGGFHLSEMAELRRLVVNLELEERVFVNYGADELGAMAVASALAPEGDENVRELRFAGLPGTIPHYEGQASIHTLRDKGKALGFDFQTVAMSGSHNPAHSPVLFLNMPRSDEGDPLIHRTLQLEFDSVFFHQALGESRIRRVFLCDGRLPNYPDQALLRFNATDLFNLAGLSGLNTYSNALGVILAMMRLDTLREGGLDWNELKFLRFMEDVLYQGVVRPQLMEQQEKGAGIEELKGMLLPLFSAELSERGFDLPAPGMCRFPDGRVFCFDFDLPWNRTFECSVQLTQKT